jgi:dTDP-4-dehydrorhamnose 3,5-epimerase-like enzyme
MKPSNMIPRIIEGQVFEDYRGSVSFVNDFKFNEIERFYIITNSEENPIRAWQGHKIDCKNFYCIQGSFRIHYVKIDNWESPSKDLVIKSELLIASESKILHIPNGYANAIESLENGAKLISFSTLPLDKISDDDVRYDINTWKVNGKF